jgi:hypothetical protein
VSQRVGVEVVVDLCWRLFAGLFGVSGLSRDISEPSLEPLLGPLGAARGSWSALGLIGYLLGHLGALLEFA